MIYNDLQESVLSLLDRNKTEAVSELTSFLDQYSDDPDAHAKVVAALINVDLDESVARETLECILKNHDDLESRLGRAVDIRTAAMDYVSRNPDLLTAPTIIAQKNLQQSQHLAVVDELTGLFNRRFLETYLAKELNRAQRYNQIFSVLFLDLDDFKKINDSHGHAVGDNVLVGLGRLITSKLRHEDFAARYGGEEFVITMPQTTANGALAFGERLREALAGMDLVPGVRVTLSGGVAAYPRHGLTVNEILHRADSSLYDAKLAGKNQLMVSQAEKRASTRYQTNLPVVAYAGNSELGQLRLCDVSADGYSLMSDNLVKPGQMLRVRLHTIEGAEPREYEVLAHVVWSRKLTDTGSYRIGGQWDPPRSEAAARIVQSVSTADKSA